MTDRIPVDGLPLALVADDREERTRWLARLLEEAGYAVLRERTARHALERGRTAQPDLIIIGGDLPDMPGIELCRELRGDRSEEHTSELQSLAYLVCRLLLEKKKKYELKAQ